MRRLLPLLLLLIPLFGCERPGAVPRAAQPPGPAARGEEAGSRPAVRVVFLGDSLTAGLGLPEEEAYPELIEAELRRRGWSIEVVNGGVSGDTTAGGRSRLGWLLEQRPRVLVVGLGANDGLRGLSVSEMEENLRAIIEESLDAGASVLLAGMRVPPNYGVEYAARFAAVFPELAADLGVPLVPFLLEGVGGRPDLNLPDGIHPNAAGHRVIAAHLLPAVEALLQRVVPESGPRAKTVAGAAGDRVEEGVEDAGVAAGAVEGGGR